MMVYHEFGQHVMLGWTMIELRNIVDRLYWSLVSHVLKVSKNGTYKLPWYLQTQFYVMVTCSIVPIRY